MRRDRPALDAFGRPVEPRNAPATATTPGATTPEAAATAPGTVRPTPANDTYARSPGPVAASTNPQAVAALVAGLLGFVLVPVVLSIAAIILGTSGVRRADALPGAPGRTMARTGRGLGWASLAFWGLLFVAAVVVAAA
jgi:hypothetical protein